MKGFAGLSYIKIPINSPGYFNITLLFMEACMACGRPFDSPLTNGKFFVLLVTSDSRIFHVVIEGVIVLRNMDVFREVGGWNPLWKTFTVYAVR